MRVMVIVKASPETEAGVLPTEQQITEMIELNEELVKAGVMVTVHGLHPSAKGVRVRFTGDERTVIEGPFTETKELIAGFWIWQVRSLDEAIAWATRFPNPNGAESELEIRPILEDEDFGDAFTPELRDREQRLRAILDQVERSSAGQYSPG